MFYAFLAGAPLVSVAVLDMRTPELGFYMGTITAGFMLGSYLSGRYSGRFTLTTMMIAGRAIACAGLVADALAIGSGAPAASFTSVAVTAGNGAFALLAIMFALAFIGLLASLYLQRFNRAAANRASD